MFTLYIKVYKLCRFDNKEIRLIDYSFDARVWRTESDCFLFAKIAQKVQRGASVLETKVFHSLKRTQRAPLTPQN